MTLEIKQIIEEKLKLIYDHNIIDIKNNFDLEKIYDFTEYLILQNQQVGFFSKNDSSNIIDRHVIEPMVYCYRIKKYFKNEKINQVADVGTGPGIPGYFMYCLISNFQTTLIDSKRRKLKFTEDYCKRKGFKNILFIYNRVEEIKNKFDLIVSRAFIPFPYNIEISSNIIKIGGFYVHFQTSVDELAIKELEILEHSGFKFIENIPIHELNYLGTRSIKILKKISNQKSGFPRSWRIIEKEMKHING